VELKIYKNRAAVVVLWIAIVNWVWEKAIKIFERVNRLHTWFSQTNVHISINLSSIIIDFFFFYGLDLVFKML